MLPAWARTCPGRAPERRTGARPSRSPWTVTATTSRSPALRSPPSTPTPSGPHASASPRARSSTQVTGVVAGSTRPTTMLVGTAPMATMSAGFCAAARAPTSRAVPQPCRKWWPSTRTSVDTTNRPSGAATTAASSPVGTSVAGPRGRRGTKREMSSPSERSPTRAAGSPEVTGATLPAPTPAPHPRRERTYRPPLPTESALTALTSDGRALPPREPWATSELSATSALWATNELSAGSGRGRAGYREGREATHRDPGSGGGTRGVLLGGQRAARPARRRAGLRRGAPAGAGRARGRRAPLDHQPGDRRVGRAAGHAALRRRGPRAEHRAVHHRGVGRLLGGLARPGERRRDGPRARPAGQRRVDLRHLRPGAGGGGRRAHRARGRPAHRGARRPRAGDRADHRRAPLRGRHRRLLTVPRPTAGRRDARARAGPARRPARSSSSRCAAT